MKCNCCGSENIIKGALAGRYTISFYKLKENDKIALRGAVPTRCLLCTDCGNVVKIFVEKKYLDKLRPTN